ncbi:integrase catalytic domain-containing protein [Trichonephila clavata]|uniref:Integrase catalytic domain-containing protein n=1 Tax=Trichonephila clavata TaxID=2740835 RepID=A0A8X6HSS4_TRICU|nr:integrase catalytic domain-containing protein [Trichonephila clavata]
MSMEKWPKFKNIEFDKFSIFDEKRSTVTSAQLSCAINKVSEFLLNLENFSNLQKVYNITAWVLRFLNNIEKRKTKISGELTAPEIEKAELDWIKQTQQFIFNREIDSLKREKSIEKYSKLYPKLDENGLLVVTGRLQFSEFSRKEKHPWILPNGEKFTILLIQYAHKKVLHFGIASTLAHLREKYFIIKGRKSVKSVLKNCIICKKFNASPGKQEIAPLPKDRTVESPPFLTCAVLFILKQGQAQKMLTLFYLLALSPELSILRASWWGGFWERMVRSVKTPLKKILGRSCLNYEEIQTTLIEIEAVINSRPLTFLYEENEEPLPLTPSHFLIGKRLNSLLDIQSTKDPESNKKILTKMFKYKEQVINHFWRRWRK